ncbi:hypothetical protein C1645_811221 [Glomus cerebriforme]|uniref:Uncharacterized protein n=1 Tax=Glomus cerebriforme TaxID=658196 RepID=A0A397TQD2_9GLOM|nr:hypothetical protein C1645_811221 [Glomus cerebriforme]
MPESHKFWEFFTLVANPNNKSNTKAVCIFSNCNNFKEAYTGKEVTEILFQNVPENKQKLNNTSMDK